MCFPLTSISSWHSALSGCYNIGRLFLCTSDYLPNETMYSFKKSLVSSDFCSFSDPALPDRRFCKWWSLKNEWARMVNATTRGGSPEQPWTMTSHTVLMARCQALGLTQYTHWLLLWSWHRLENGLWGEWLPTTK